MSPNKRTTTAHREQRSSISERASLETAMTQEKNPVKRLFKVLGPGLVTGASDDNPSGIGTYGVAGSSLVLATRGAFCFRGRRPISEAARARGSKSHIHSQPEFRFEFSSDAGGNSRHNDLSVSFFLASRSGSRRGNQFWSHDFGAASRRERKR